MGALAEAGHGATLAVELDPTGSPGVFTVIAELADEVNPPGWEVPEDEVTASQDNIDYWIAGRLGRSQGNIGAYYAYSSNTHDSTDGLQAAVVNRETRGFRFRGPSGSDGSDERIGSGFVVSLNFTNPVGQGPRKMDCVYRLSGPEKIDGTIVGT